MGKEEEITKRLKTVNSIIHILWKSPKGGMNRYLKNLIR